MNLFVSYILISAVASHTDVCGFFIARDGCFMLSSRYADLPGPSAEVEKSSESSFEPSAVLSELPETVPEPSEPFSELSGGKKPAKNHITEQIISINH